MTDRPDQQLLDVRMHALTLAVTATAPLDGLQIQLESTLLADYFEAWLLRAPDQIQSVAEVEEDMTRDLRQATTRLTGAVQPGGTT